MRIRLLAVGGVTFVLALGGCQLFQKIVHPKAKAPAGPQPVTVRSFSESAGVTAVAATEPTLWVGTAHGLWRWDLKATSFALLTKAQGLPGNRILALAPDASGSLWALTDGGLTRESRGAWRPQPASPLGTSVTAMASTADGTLWVGGADGLGRLRGASKGGTSWDRLLGKTPVLSLGTAGSELWVGTGGRGVVRVVGDKVEVYGIDQGCEVHMVRAIAQAPFGVVALGESEDGPPRLAVWDGKRFYSYKIDWPAGSKPEWVRRIGQETLLGGGSHAYALTAATVAQPQSGPVKLAPVEVKPVKPAFTGAARGELPTTAPKQEAPRPAAKAADTRSAEARKADLSTEPPPPPPEKEVAPSLDTAAWGKKRLPDDITAVGPSGAALYLGTQFLGAVRLDGGEETDYRTGDLAQTTDALSVACESSTKDCYLASGGERAFRYDGESFEPAGVDPEAGARVMAVVATPQKGVVAIHRGAKDPAVRLSTAGDGTWAPLGIEDVQVPEGVPVVTFAVVAPDRRLWIGLRYVDKAGDRIDYGAAEVAIDKGAVIYHRKFSASAEPRPGQGTSLPNDVSSVYFRGAGEAWFGTHAGVAQMKGRSVRLFTESDGLETETIRGITEGPDGKIWVGTSKGVGSYDGARWSFAKEGPLKAKVNAIARDLRGYVFVGGDEGIYVQGPPDAPPIGRIDAAHGLLDNKVLHLAVDRRNRLWVMTEKGLSVVSR